MSTSTNEDVGSFRPRRLVPLVASVVGAALIGSALTLAASPAEAATPGSDVYVLTQSRTIQKISPTLGRSVVGAGITDAVDISTDPAGRLYVLSPVPKGAGSTVTIIGTDGSISQTATVTIVASAIAVGTDGRFYLSNNGGIYKVTPSSSSLTGGGVTKVANDIAVDLAVTGSGKLIAATDSGLVAISPNGVRTPAYAGWTTAASAVAATPLSRDVWIRGVNSAGTTGTYRVTSNGLQPYPASSAVTPAMAVDAAGGLISWTTPGNVLDTSAAGDQSVLASDIELPLEIATGRTGGVTGTLPLDAPPTITGVAPTLAATGKPFSYSYSITGSPTPALVVVSGAIPDGLSLNQNGTLSGTPTKGGSFSFTILAGSSEGAANVRQSITIASPPGIAGTPTDATIGAAYSWSFGLSGYPATTVSVSSGSLPDGLSLNGQTGVVSGTPTKVGTWTVQLRGTNGYQAATGGEGVATATATFTVLPQATGQVKFVSSSPASVATGAWESNSDLRIFQEQAGKVLTAPVTIDGTTIPAGTKVNVYYANADAVGNANVAHAFAGSMSFGSPVLGIAVLSADVQSTTALFGLPGTTYSTSADQGAERWAGDVAIKTADGTGVNLSLTVWNTSDAVRIITLAP